MSQFVVRENICGCKYQVDLEIILIGLKAFISVSPRDSIVQGNKTPFYRAPKKVPHKDSWNVELTSNVRPS